MNKDVKDCAVIFEVVNRGEGDWRLSVNGADDTAPFPSSEAASATARIRAKHLHLDTGVPVEVHAPNRGGDVECMIRYLHPEQLDNLCHSQRMRQATFGRTLFVSARAVNTTNLMQQDGDRRR